MFLKAPKSKENVEKPANPVKGTIFVAKTFPQWQQIVLETLKTMYQVNNDDLISKISKIRPN